MSTTAEAPETVTLECDEDGCGETFTGPAEGAGSAKWKLASHRYRIHGIKADGSRRATKAKGRAGTSSTTEPDRPAVAVVRSITEPLEGGSGAPSTDALTKAFGHGLQLVSLTAASYAAESEDNISEADRDAIVADLALSQKQAQEITRPIAKLVQPTKVNRKYGRTAVENVDAFAAVLEVFELGMHWRRYFRQRAARRPMALGDGAVLIPPGPPLEAAPHDPGGTATPAEAVVETSGGLGGGVVVDAEMVQRARRGGS